MKKFILAAVAASLVATPALAAPQPGPKAQTQTQTLVKQKPNGTVIVKQKVAAPKRAVKPAPSPYRNWKKGERFDSRYARNYRQVDYRQFHGRLKAPPKGYRYVQSGNDAVLVGVTSGIIAAVFASIFN
ncbi:RcnB family protein [Sphingomonas canadensis]|uniref:RcnB family protein n=1 Tax=Sphingomonas canadensis TaxID=1219257 RepID=A0ABW3H7Q5_9SPHN|nr:RcnB family protein [Sphingomonas canadensis]MCW3836664.1 RcnB family protein [Sphingomonas canadensis]